MDGIRTVLMRGGTSRGLVIDADALPADPDARQRAVAGLFGAGTAGQIDGVGGATVNTSKVAVVSRSTAPDADVDYLFGQVATDRASVDFSGTCGNLASAVALYAVEEGMADGRVRIRNVSSGQVLSGEVLDEPAQRYADGAMPGTGTAIALDLAGLAGASTGKGVLPTGEVSQPLPLPDGRTVPATVIDIGNVLSFVPASALGLTGDERPEQIEGSPAMAALAELRAATAVALGWCDSPEQWQESASRLPFVALVAGGRDDSDVTVRLYAVGRVHRAIAVTAVGACGAAAAQSGSAVREVLRRPFDAGGRLRVSHPGGTAEITVTVAGDGSGAAGLRYVRTARRLMEGVGFAPA